MATKVIASKTNLRPIDAALMADLDNAAYSFGAASRVVIELMLSIKVKVDDKDAWKELSAAFRRGYFAAHYARRDAATVNPTELKDHAYKLADALIAKAIAARTDRETKLYNAGKSAFDHMRKIAGVAPTKAPATPRPKKADAPEAKNAATSIEGEITIPKVTSPDAGLAQAMHLANLLDRAIKTNGDNFRNGIMTAFAVCIADVRKLAKQSEAEAKHGG